MHNDTSSAVHFRSSSRTTPATSRGDVSMTLTTTAHSPQQLMVVWNHFLPSGPEGPNLHLHHSTTFSRLWLLHQNLPMVFGTHGGTRRAAPDSPGTSVRRPPSAGCGGRRTSGVGVGSRETRSRGRGRSAPCGSPVESAGWPG